MNSPKDYERKAKTALMLTSKRRPERARVFSQAAERAAMPKSHLPAGPVFGGSSAVGFAQLRLLGGIYGRSVSNRRE